MNKFSEYGDRVNRLLGELPLPGDEFKGLYEPITYSLSAGGKRLRPSLALMSADAFGGFSDRAENAALGLEIFHNFTLLHDDVMDDSAMRRGRQSVHARWDENTAILSGDTMLTLATQFMMRVPDNFLRRVLEIFNDMAIKVYEGQRLDMDFEDRDNVTIEEYIRMISLKTGALLAASTEIGALLGGASEEDIRLIGDYGMNLGIAFQIQDDWLDVFGDASTFGKPIGGDINNNKKSFLLLTGLASEGSDAQALRDCLKLPSSDTKVKTVTKIYERLDVSDKCRTAIASYSSRALSALKSTSLGDDRREPFRLLVDKLTGRKK